MTTTHPSHPSVRIAPDTLIDIVDLLQADRFELIGDDVTFEAQRGAETQRWHGRLGDRLAADGRGYWRIVGSEPWDPISWWDADPSVPHRADAGGVVEPGAAA